MLKLVYIKSTLQCNRPIFFSVPAVDGIIRDVLAALSEHNAVASKALTDSTEALHAARERNFSLYSSNITENIRMVENTSSHVEDALRRVSSFGWWVFKCGGNFRVIYELSLIP